MITIETKVQTLIERHSRALITTTEVVNSLLLTLADVGEAQRITSLFDGLPGELRSAVCSRLDELRDSGFNWRPFMIGEGLSETELEWLTGRLRFVHESLHKPDQRP